jgi:hypothetical protein
MLNTVIRVCDLRILINKLFDDHRILMAVIMGWLVLVLVVFTEMGLMKSEFVRFGPSETTEYVGIKLNTWRKWASVAIFSALSSFMNDFANESLEPLFINVLRDPKQRYIPYSKFTCVLITQCWTIYGSIMSLFALYTYFSQLDFLLIKLLVALLVGQYSTLRYMRNKIHEPVKFAQYYQQRDEDEIDDVLNNIFTGDLHSGARSAPLQSTTQTDGVANQPTSSIQTQLPANKPTEAAAAVFHDEVANVVKKHTEIDSSAHIRPVALEPSFANSKKKKKQQETSFTP